MWTYNVWYLNLDGRQKNVYILLLLDAVLENVIALYNNIYYMYKFNRVALHLDNINNLIIENYHIIIDQAILKNYILFEYR